MRLYPFFIPHAGCPHRCLFCRQQQSGGGDEPPSPAVVSGALEQMLPRCGDGEVAFFGGTFTLLPTAQQQAWLEAVAPFVHSGRVAGIRVSTRPDALAPGAAEWLAGLGVTTVELGCQSFSADVLRLAGRGHDEGAAAGAVCRLRRAGLAVGLQLMPGLPGGDRAEAMASLTSALALAPDFLRIYPTVVLRDTGLAQWYLDGLYCPVPLEEAVDWCAEMLWYCRRAGVPVIRLGLQSTPELDGGETLLAGPYHPAFGQLVRSRLWLRALLRGLAVMDARLVAVHPAELADVIGQRRGNLCELQRRFGDFNLVPDSALSRGHLALDGQDFLLMDLSAYEG
ncbi:MAG TPA: radical SAM protein [Desulfuromonadales bacterium]|nr:radical SAM protein [Desulfuromonadales bacterium]